MRFASPQPAPPRVGLEVKSFLSSSSAAVRLGDATAQPFSRRDWRSERHRPSTLIAGVRRTDSCSSLNEREFERVSAWHRNWR